MDIGNRIKFLAEKNNISISEISAKTQIPNSTLSDIINGRTKNLSIQKAKLICNALGCSLDYLLDNQNSAENRNEALQSNKILAELYEVAKGLSEEEQLYLLDTVKALKQRLSREPK